MADVAVRSLLVSGLVLVLAGTGTAFGEEFRYLAFGDSITLGNYDSFPPPYGYPARLNNKLDCSPGVCEVYNAGKSGEKTYQGVTRIDNVLNNQGPFDVLLLMEGTNDIFVEASVESAVANLGIMANKARSRGTDTIHASIIWYHPGGVYGTSKDDEVEYIRDSMELLADAYHRYFVDIWDVLCPDSHPDVHGHNQTQCFNQHYSDAPPDDRGHPVASGYNMMANAFKSGILSVPPPGLSTPTWPIGVVTDSTPQVHWDRESPEAATWYQLVIENGASTVYDVWLEARVYCPGDSCALTLPVTLDDDEYTWSIRGRNPAGNGPWTADTGFRIDTQPIFEDDFESGDTSNWSASN